MKRGNIAAIDLGGTYLRTALVQNNKIRHFLRRPTPTGKGSLLKMLFSSFSEIRRERKDIRGIGVACPGPLKNGVILNPPNIPLKNFDLKKALQKELRMPVEIENDAKCVALAELHLGVKKENFFILTLGTGIGGGVVINREIYNAGDIGTELGHIYLDKGKRFEELVSGKVITQKTREIFGKELLAQDLLNMKDTKAKKILNEIVDYLSQGIGSLINIFNPEIVVLAGGMKSSGDKFLTMIQERTKKYVSLPGEYHIVWSKLEEPGILGASLLI